jgi:hypothetical protein
MSNKWELQTHQVNAYCYYQNVFDNDMIDSIVEAGDKLEIGDAYVGGDIQKAGVVDESIRRTQIAWFNGTAENAWLFRKLTDVIQAANNPKNLKLHIMKLNMDLLKKIIPYHTKFSV